MVTKTGNYLVQDSNYETLCPNHITNKKDQFIIMQDVMAIGYVNYIFNSPRNKYLIVLNGSEKQLMKKIKEKIKEKISIRNIYFLRNPSDYEIESISNIGFDKLLLQKVITTTTEFFRSLRSLA